MRKTIVYDKRHPSGPFLSSFFTLIMFASAFGAISGIVVMFQGGEMIGIGFLLLLVCGGMTVLSFFIPRWIEDAVISRYEQNRKPKSKLINNKDKNDADYNQEKYWEGFEFREVKPSFDETMEYYDMMNNLFRPLMISGNPKFYIVRDSERNIYIRIIDFNRSPNSTEARSLMSHLFMIYQNENTKKPNDYIVVKPYLGYPGWSSIEKRKYDDRNKLIECTDFGAVPEVVKTIGDLIKMIIDTFCTASLNKKNEIKATKPSDEEKNAAKKTQNHSEQKQPQAEITIKPVNCTNEDVLMLTNQFRQTPYQIYKHAVNYKNINMEVFKLEYKSQPMVGTILFLFLIPRKNKENDSDSIFYVAIEDSFDSCVICSWEFDKNKKEISHYNYGSLEGKKYRPQDLIKIVCDRVGI